VYVCQPVATIVFVRASSDLGVYVRDSAGGGGAQGRAAEAVQSNLTVTGNSVSVDLASRVS
jgi:hypothetical protein